VKKILTYLTLLLMAISLCILPGTQYSAFGYASPVPDGCDA